MGGSSTNCTFHPSHLHQLRDVGVGDAVFNVIAGFLSDIVTRIVIDGIYSENVRVATGVHHGSVLGLFLFCRTLAIW